MSLPAHGTRQSQFNDAVVFSAPAVCVIVVVGGSLCLCWRTIYVKNLGRIGVNPIVSSCFYHPYVLDLSDRDHASNVPLARCFRYQNGNVSDSSKWVVFYFL